MSLDGGSLPGYGTVRRADGLVVVAGRHGDGRLVDLGSGSLTEALRAGRWQALRDALEGGAGGEPLDPGSVTVLRPIDPADYVDFYACEHHAANLGRRFRPGGEPLLPNWRHLPVGYHGRTSTVVVSGSEVNRPSGLRPAPDGGPPSFGPTERLDVEVEVGFVLARGSERGRPVPVSEARDHIAGCVLVNDWSARDIQAFEYQPLGPHLGKSFATSVSPWVVPLDLLPAVEITGTGVALAPYLVDAAPGGLDLPLELRLDGAVVSRTNARHLAWSPAQLLAHLTVNGASTTAGDLFASGTISGPDPGSFGSLIELDHPFLLDGQEVEISCPLLGTVRGRIAPPF